MFSRSHVWKTFSLLNDKKEEQKQPSVCLLCLLGAHYAWWQKEKKSRLDSIILGKLMLSTSERKFSTFKRNTTTKSKETKGMKLNFLLLTLKHETCQLWEKRNNPSEQLWEKKLAYVHFLVLKLDHACSLGLWGWVHLVVTMLLLQLDFCR